jgi:cytochrome c oxidase cbb3-type subunit 3
MADFVSDFWHWFIIIPTVIGILALFPLIYANRGDKVSADEVGTTGHVWDDDLEEFNNPLPGWWLNMFVITIVFGIIYLILYPGLGRFEGVLGWSSKGQYEAQVDTAEKTYGPIYQKYAAIDIKTLVKDPEALNTGERLFANYCTVCHGSDARGARGYPNLRDQDWLYGGEPEQIKTSILSGRNGVMPGWDAVIGADGVHDVTEYVVSLSGRNHDAGVAARGKVVFESTCVACHQADGTRNHALGAPNLTDRIWLYGGSRKSIIESIKRRISSTIPRVKDSPANPLPAPRGAMGI